MSDADKDKPVVNFTVLRNVEDYVETSGKFRTSCTSFAIPGKDSGGVSAIYIPYCQKQRFDFGPFLNQCRGLGVYRPPETGKPWQATDFILFREHFHDIQCPVDCRGYRSRRLAGIVQVVKRWLQPEATNRGGWSRADKIAGATLLVTLVGILVAIAVPEVRRFFHLEKTPEVSSPQSSAPASTETDPDLSASVDTEKKFTKRTTHELLSLYVGRTALQADKLVEPYKGLWINAEGKIKLVLPGSLTVVAFQQGADALECTVRQKVGPRPESLQSGRHNQGVRKNRRYSKRATTVSPRV